MHILYTLKDKNQYLINNKSNFFYYLNIFYWKKNNIFKLP